MSTQWTLGKFYVNTCLLSINLVPGLYVGPEKKESQSLYSSSHLAVGETGSASERDGPVHLSAKGLRTPHLHLRSPSPGTASFGDEPAPRDACRMMMLPTQLPLPRGARLLAVVHRESQSAVTQTKSNGAKDTWEYQTQDLFVEMVPHLKRISPARNETEAFCQRQELDEKLFYETRILACFHISFCQKADQ
ncbi:hypothetical protein VULLAG_LOCUS1996 [Vulpes lagopus]